MTRLLLITLLVLSSGPAYAEWVAINGSRNTGGYTSYADLDTIRGDGDLVNMWILYNFTTVQTNTSTPYSSYKVQNEFDCAEERGRLLTATFFSGQMGGGQVLHSDSRFKM